MWRICLFQLEAIRAQGSAAQTAFTPELCEWITGLEVNKREIEEAFNRLSGGRTLPLQGVPPSQTPHTDEEEFENYEISTVQGLRGISKEIKGARDSRLSRGGDGTYYIAADTEENALEAEPSFLADLQSLQSEPVQDKEGAYYMPA